MRHAPDSWLLAVCLAGAMAADAAAFSARVRWSPSVDPRVIGYEVAVRPAGAAYGTPIDVGLPAPDGDGSLGYVVGGLTAGTAYRFTVKGYDDDGVRSGCPGELTLGTADPCLDDQCCPGSQCYFGYARDGIPCGDACSICGVGACSAPTSEPTLETTRFRLALRASGNRLRAKGSFVPTGTIDPTIGGLTLNVAGDQILGVVVPRPAVLTNGDHSTFRLSPGASVPSLRSLRITTGGGLARVKASLNDSNLDLSTTGWALRIGGVCARATDLDCTIVSNGVTCR